MDAMEPILPEVLELVDTASIPVVVIVVKVAYGIEVEPEPVELVVRWSHWVVPITAALAIVAVGVAVVAVLLFGKSF